MGTILKEMGKYLELNSISTGTMTRIDLTKASSNFFFICVFVIHNVHSLLLTVGCVFPVRANNGALIIIWSNLTLKCQMIATFSFQYSLL